MIALLALAATLLLFVAWCVFDFAVSIRLVPGQHTASMYIKRWARERPWHRLLLALVVVDGAAYLLLHLVLQKV